MGTLDHADATRRDQIHTWLALPRLLVSRRWRWLTLGVIVLAIVLANLGLWQLRRRDQRLASNALIASRLNAPPTQLTGQPIDLAQSEYQRVVVSGQYDPANEIVLRNRSYGGMPGGRVLTPLRIDGSEQAVLIDRGWVPLDQVEQRAPFAVSGHATVEGIIRRPVTRASSLLPEDRIPAGGRLDQWFRPDTALIAQQLPYPIYQFYIEQAPGDSPADLPRAEITVDYQDEGPHLSYAIQWFGFMLILLGGYAALVVTRSRATS